MKIKFYVFWEQYDWEEIGKLIYWHIKIDDTSNRFFLREIEVEMPEEIIPTREQIARLKVAALESDRQAILAKTHMKITAIDEKIKQLSALPNYAGADEPGMF